MKDKIYFDKDVTNVLKGVALIMMFVHHFFTFPTWWVDGISYPFFLRVHTYLIGPLKLCVQIFAFLTGYFYFFNKSKNYKYSFKKITDIFIWYWGFFFLFALIAVLCGHTYTLSDFILELFSLKSTTMRFGWYVYFYCISMLLMPLFSKILSKNIFLDVVISFFIFPYLIRWGLLNNTNNVIIRKMIINFYPYFPVMLAGFMCAKYNIFQRLDELLHKFIHSKLVNTITLFLMLIISFTMCYALLNLYISTNSLPIVHKTIVFIFEMKIIYTPLFIYSFINLYKSFKLKYTGKVLSSIGKYSMLMWFASCIFFGVSCEVFQPILYLPRDPLLVLLWGLLLCYLVSFVLDKVFIKIINLKNKLIFNEK